MVNRVRTRRLNAYFAAVLYMVSPCKTWRSRAFLEKARAGLSTSPETGDIKSYVNVNPCLPWHSWRYPGVIHLASLAEFAHARSRCRHLLHPNHFALNIMLCYRRPTETFQALCTMFPWPPAKRRSLPLWASLLWIIISILVSNVRSLFQPPSYYIAQLPESSGRVMRRSHKASFARSLRLVKNFIQPTVGGWS